MNFIFISPEFPKTYWNFCRCLKANGVVTLAIGESAFETLSLDLRNSIDEYFKVSSLENYDEVYRACAFLAFKHGRIDWIESNNEYWLEMDARLRSDFNINSGIKSDRIHTIKYKSKMKQFYKKAGVPVARHHMVSSLEAAKTFIKEVQYPVIVKPDNGVGASSTYQINNELELTRFYNEKPPLSFIMEEYINGTIYSYDGIADKNREVVFEAAHLYPDSIMELVNNQEDVWFYSLKEIPRRLREIGRQVIRSFDSNSRFFHCEYFCLKEDKAGLGKKGDFIALEVNMRPPGGYIPDMMNFARDTDVYHIWANMISENNKFSGLNKIPYSCVYAARRDTHTYSSTIEEVSDKYKDNLMMIENMPAVLAHAMGNDAFIARFKSEKEAIAFAKDILK